MSNLTNVELNTISTIIDAKLSARGFPGLKVEPSADDADTFDIIHTIAHQFDRMSVPLHALVVEVNNMLLELECAFGRGGEKLFDQPLHIELKEEKS